MVAIFLHHLGLANPQPAAIVAGEGQRPNAPGGNAEEASELRRVENWEENWVAVKQYYSYGVNADGTRWPLSCSDPAATHATFDPLASAHPWSKSTTDFLGRTVTDERPAFGGGTLVTSNSYNTLVATARYHNPVNPVNPVETLSQTHHVYDDLGALVQTAQDITGRCMPASAAIRLAR